MFEVSIILPNFNHEAFLEKRLESIFQQTFNDYEVILLDDGSTDNSVKLLSTFSNHPKVTQFVVNEANSGSPFIQWEKGFELATGKFIWIAESDDWAEPTFLEEMIPFMKKGCAMSYCRSKIITMNGMESSFWTERINPTQWETSFIHDGIDEIKNHLIYLNTIPNASACLFRRDISFPKEILEMKYAGDWLFWILMLENSIVGYSSKSLNNFRFDSGISNTFRSKGEEWQRFKEITNVIKYGRSISKSGKITFKECGKYRWLTSSYMKRFRVFGIKILTPPFPIILTLYMYLSLFLYIPKIFRSSISKK